jgi:CRP/FNR family transcriptional regulator, cyclic AMP receptor protein
MGLFDYPIGTDQTPGAAEYFVFLEHLPEQSWKKLLNHAETISFHKGQIIVRSGAMDAALYIITEGSVEVVVDGDGPALTIIPAGSVFGEISFFDGRPRSATIRAQSDGRAVRLTRDGFDQLSGWDPVLGRHILIDLGKILALRLRWTTMLAQGASNK